MEKKGTLAGTLNLSDDFFMVRELRAEDLSTEIIRLDCCLILLCIAGNAVMFIENRDYQVKVRSEALLLPDTLFRIRSASHDFKVKMFIFSRQIAWQAFMRFDALFYNQLYLNPFYRFAEGDEKKSLAYYEILECIQADVRNRYKGIIATNLLRSFCLDVYDKIQRHSADDGSPETSSRKDAIYSRFVTLLTNEIREHHDVAWYAGKLCISTRYLTEVAKSVAGESPKQTIDYMLVQELKILLTFSEMSISEIADRLNFPDQSYLGRYFRHHTGVSPSDYRKKLQDL